MLVIFKSSSNLVLYVSLNPVSDEKPSPTPIKDSIKDGVNSSEFLEERQKTNKGKEEAIVEKEDENNNTTVHDDYETCKIIWVTLSPIFKS